MKSKFILLIVLLVTLTSASFAQKFNYKNGIINVDGKDIARVNKIKDKENFGLTSSFELYSLKGEKLIIATIASEFAERENDNMNFYYRFSFLKNDLTGIFTINKLGAEKSFAKLIGESGIMVNDEIDNNALKAFIAMKSKNPKTSVEYNLVRRDRSQYPLYFKEPNKIIQGVVEIGTFTDVTEKNKGYDQYEINLPSGLTVAKIKFTGGNNAKVCEVTTLKDSNIQNINIESGEKIFMSSSKYDRNSIALKRIVEWLSRNNYL